MFRSYLFEVQIGCEKELLPKKEGKINPDSVTRINDRFCIKGSR